MMRAEAELLLEDADTLGSDGYEDRTHEQRAADASSGSPCAWATKLADPLRLPRDCQAATSIDQPASPRHCDLGLQRARRDSNPQPSDP
jgi:hypothetical protein